MWAIPWPFTFTSANHYHQHLPLSSPSISSLPVSSTFLPSFITVTILQVRLQSPLIPSPPVSDVSFVHALFSIVFIKDTLPAAAVTISFDPFTSCKCYFLFRMAITLSVRVAAVSIKSTASCKCLFHSFICFYNYVWSAILPASAVAFPFNPCKCHFVLSHFSTVSPNFFLTNTYIKTLSNKVRLQLIPL